MSLDIEIYIPQNILMSKVIYICKNVAVSESMYKIVELWTLQMIDRIIHILQNIKLLNATKYILIFNIYYTYVLYCTLILISNIYQ